MITLSNARRFAALAVVVLWVVGARVGAAERVQGRSMVVTRYGIVASEHPLASQAGASMLAAGGSAVDAALAANATLGAVAPMMCGIGGDLFAIVFDARSGQLHGLNASGWAPADLTLEFLKSRGFTNMPQAGIHSVTVPGAVDGWDKLLGRFGRLKLAQVLAPAIHHAEEGFPVSELVAEYWAASEKKLQRDTNAARAYLPGGHAPRLGEVYRNPDLAWAYRQLVRHGRRAYYEGEIARRLVAHAGRMGGTLAAADLRAFSSVWVEPISTTYRGWSVYEIPPNGQGIAALMMLNLMETVPLAQYGQGSAAAFHTMIEAKKLAYADMLRYVADPKVSAVPVGGMLSKKYAAERARLIDPDKANAQVAAGEPPAGADTTYLCAVDRDGNMISLIQSNYESFGSGLVADGTGFALQNRGGLFSLDPKHPNALAGHKRPLHTIIPGFMSKGGVRIAFGIMGGWNQSQAHAQFVANIVDYQLNLQAALESPRFTKMTFASNDVQIESRVAPEIRAQLEAKGHQLKVIAPFAQAVGGGQAVMRDFSARVNYGASDPRKDGAAVPEPLRVK